MKYKEIIALKRGDSVGDDVVLYVAKSSRGGVGMREYPAGATVVLKSGKVLAADEWGSSRVVHKALLRWKNWRAGNE